MFGELAGRVEERREELDGDRFRVTEESRFVSGEGASSSSLQCIVHLIGNQT